MRAARTAPSGPGARPRLRLLHRFPWLGRPGGLVLAGVLLAGCGSASAPKPHRALVAAAGLPAVCRPALRVIARAAWSASTGNNGQPECRMSSGRVRAVVNVDRSPQPYQRLEREIVEDNQQFGAVRAFAPPQTVRGVGLDAAWLPSLSQLVTADSRRLVAVTISGAGTAEAARRALAVRLARATLAGGA